ncbi:hypothetical protein ACXR2T_10735 [Leucobacter sp. HY1910]
MAGTMSDIEAMAVMPAVREFVQLVGECDQAGVQAALAHTPPPTLAVLTAELVVDGARQRDLAAQAFQRAYAEWRVTQAKAEEQIAQDAVKIAALEQDRARQADRLAVLREQLHAASEKLKGRK